MSGSFSVVEIGALSFRQAEEKGDPYVDASDYVAQVLEHFLRDGTFSRLARLKTTTGLFAFARSHPDAPCRVVVSRQDALRSKEDLQRACMKGLEALFVLSQATPLVLEYCLKAQYRITHRTTLGSGEPGDVLVQFSDPHRVAMCLDLLEVKRGECVAVFAHDADPLYLIEPSALTRESRWPSPHLHSAAVRAVPPPAARARRPRPQAGVPIPQVPLLQRQNSVRLIPVSRQTRVTGIPAAARWMTCRRTCSTLSMRVIGLHLLRLSANSSQRMQRRWPSLLPNPHGSTCQHLLNTGQRMNPEPAAEPRQARVTTGKRREGC